MKATKKSTKETDTKPAAKPKLTTKKSETVQKKSTEITVNGNKLMSTLQNEFSKKFPYLILCFIIDADRGKLVNVKSINTHKSISDIRKKFSNKEISIHGATIVKNIENYFWNELGIACQIGICNYSGHQYYFPIGDFFNGVNLTQANKWAQNANCTKADANVLKMISSGNIF